ncbi:MAG: 3-deoxy-D-manno-octulosonic acid transferase [Acidobacteria bacterium]|nr:MAG: 3-deoxy-D-manno-octulosonic acid transferase [Acidobacteriota bacterium]
MYVFYSALLAVWLLITLPYWLIQMGRHGKYRAGLAQRFGKLPDWLGTPPSKPIIWVHAVSVGEVLTISGLVAELRLRFPEHRIVVSTTTGTGQKLARKRFGEDNVFYFPLDFAFTIRPYLRALAPQLIIIAETEFWPNFLRLAKKNGSKIAVVNARISDRSFPGYRRLRPWLSRALTNIDLFLTQTEEDSRRLAEIGAAAQRIQISGNLKFDVSPPAPPPIVESLRSAFYQASAGPILVCGSTVDDEEPLLLRAFENVLASHPRAVMILAPRYPERFREVAELLKKLGLRFWRRSLWSGEAIAGGVFFVDTIGELAALYSLGTLAFVGGSLVPRGGHNIIEPAQYGVPIIIGTHTENFRDVVSLFRAQNALKVVGPAELPLAFMELISDEGERMALGRRAADTIRAQQGATQRVLVALDALLGRSAVTPDASAQ